MSYEPPGLGGYGVMLWVVALLAVTGCVSKRVVPDAVNGKRILLPTPVALSPPVVVTFVDGVAAIPLVGWFKVARDSKQAKAVGEMLSATGLDVPTEFAAALHSELSAQGVTAIAALPVLRKPLKPTSVWPKESDLPTREATECFVDVSLVYGFSATTNGVNYEPYMVANVKVSNALTHRVSLRRTIGYNFSAGMHVTVDPLVRSSGAGPRIRGLGGVIALDGLAQAGFTRSTGTRIDFAGPLPSDSLRCRAADSRI